MIERYRFLRGKNSFLARLTFLYHLSLVLFLVSLSLVPFMPGLTQYSSAVAVLFLMVFLLAGFLKRNQLVDGEKYSAFSMAGRYKDHSILVLSIFMMFSLYVVLNQSGILPGIYADEFPRSYYQLVNKASLKEEKPENGKYRYERFIEEYKTFLRHQSARAKNIE
jgi:hypothetical protein